MDATTAWVWERQTRWEARCNVCRSVPMPTRRTDRDTPPPPGVCPWCGQAPSALEAAVILTDLLDHPHPKGPAR